MSKTDEQAVLMAVFEVNRKEGEVDWEQQNTAWCGDVLAACTLPLEVAFLLQCNFRATRAILHYPVLTAWLFIDTGP
jgi:hypothetical protein